MSQIYKLGKDIIILATKEDHSVPSKVKLSDPEPQPSLTTPDGQINWTCPCLKGLPTGPCGYEFREAFNCFHESKAEVKGSDCTDWFVAMSLCMKEYPVVYGNSVYQGEYPVRRTGKTLSEPKNSDVFNILPEVNE